MTSSDTLANSQNNTQWRSDLLHSKANAATICASSLTGRSPADYTVMTVLGRAPARSRSPRGVDRANLRSADVDGDGRYDLVWVDKFNGDGCVSYHQV